PGPGRGFGGLRDCRLRCERKDGSQDHHWTDGHSKSASHTTLLPRVSITLSLRATNLLFLQMSVNQFFREFNTFEFVQLRVLFLMPLNDRSDLPGPRIYCFILDARFVADVIGVAQREALDNVGVSGLKISRSIEPAIAIQPADIDDKRIALPVAVRRSHPCIHGGFSECAHVDHAI